MAKNSGAPMVSRWRDVVVCVRFTVCGVIPRKNRRTRTRVVTTRGGKSFVQYYPSEEWREWIDALYLATIGVPPIRRGAWALRIWTYHDKLRHLDDGELDVALGDVDSPTSGVLDGLADKAVAILDDDARFVDEHTTKHYDEAGSRVVVELTRVDPEPIQTSKRKKRRCTTSDTTDHPLLLQQLPLPPSWSPPF